MFSGSRLDHTSIQARLDTILLVETAAYIMCEEKPIDPVVFQRIMTSRNVPSRIFRMADSNNDGQLLVDELMAFLITISMPRLDNFFVKHPNQVLFRIVSIMYQRLSSCFFSTLSFQQGVIFECKASAQFIVIRLSTYLRAKSLLHMHI